MWACIGRPIGCESKVTLPLAMLAAAASFAVLAVPVDARGQQGAVGRACVELEGGGALAFQAFLILAWIKPS